MGTTKDNNVNKRCELLDKLTESISNFVDEADRPEDGVLVINPADPFEYKIVYVEDLLFPQEETAGWDEYPVLEIIGGDDVAEMDREINPDELEQIISNYEL